LLFARLRYFDPEKRRAGVPTDVAALVSELTDATTIVTIVNTGTQEPRMVVVQGGAYGEHQIEWVEVAGERHPIGARAFTVKLAPGGGAKLTLAMKRYANVPTLKFPWESR
jgi:hypothetical protein